MRKADSMSFSCGIAPDVLKRHVFIVMSGTTANEGNEYDESLIPNDCRLLWLAFKKSGFDLDRFMMDRDYELVGDEEMHIGFINNPYDLLHPDMDMSIRMCVDVMDFLLCACLPLVQQPISRYAMDWLNGDVDFTQLKNVLYKNDGNKISNMELLRTLYFCQKDIIEIFDFHFWVEASGAIEHYFKKFNGYPMPNIIASVFLNISSELIRLSTKDMIHYERQISNQWFEKMIFGAKGKEVYEAVIAAVEDYSSFLEDVNNISEGVDAIGKYSVKQAMYIIENIYRANEEDHFNELIPSCYNALRESLEVLMAAKPSRTINDYIDYCHYLFETMPVLELHTIDI